MQYVIPIDGISIDNHWWYIKNFVCKTCILREFDSENRFSIRKYNYSDRVKGFHTAGGVLISEIFGISSGIGTESFDITFGSWAGEHHIRINEGHEQL